MISMTCSLSLLDNPLVGSSKRYTSANPIMSRPMLSRLRSPPLSAFFTALPTMRIAAFVEAEFDELAVDAPGAFTRREMR